MLLSKVVKKLNFFTTRMHHIIGKIMTVWCTTHSIPNVASKRDIVKRRLGLRPKRWRGQEKLYYACSLHYGPWPQATLPFRSPVELRRRKCWRSPCCSECGTHATMLTAHRTCPPLPCRGRRCLTSWSRPSLHCLLGDLVDTLAISSPQDEDEETLIGTPCPLHGHLILITGRHSLLSHQIRRRVGCIMP